MKILIIGASGHLGAHLVASFVDERTNHDITALALDATTAESLQCFQHIKKYDVDICNKKQLEPFIKVLKIPYLGDMI